MSRAHSQPFRHFTYVTTHSPTLPSLHLRQSSFSNPPFASPTSQALHLRHLASRPWTRVSIHVRHLSHWLATVTRKLCSAKRCLQFTEEVVIAWCQIRTVRCCPSNFSHLPVVLWLTCDRAFSCNCKTFCFSRCGRKRYSRAWRFFRVATYRVFGNSYYKLLQLVEGTE